MTISLASDSNELAHDLYGHISEMWVIDSHEHLSTEAARLAMPVDAVSLFENYPRFDLMVAGMSEAEYATMIDRELPVEARWPVFNTYYPLIRNTSFTRTTLLGVRELYGFTDVTGGNYQMLSQAMQAANKPGIFRHAFHDLGRILVALNQTYVKVWAGLPESGSFCIPQMWEAQFNVAVRAESLQDMEVDLGRSIHSFDAYLEGLAEMLHLYRSKGVVGIKLEKPIIQSSPQRSDVRQFFDKVFLDKIERLTPLETSTLRDFVAHAIIRIAGEVDLVIIQHCGHRGLWKDYTVTNPTSLIPLFARYPDTKFELYHAGLPWGRDSGMIAKVFPNVWLNMCWAHSLSARMARSVLDEWLDLVPANKITVFGGDTHLWLEWTLGELVQTRENVSAVLAKRIRDRMLTEEQALDLARMMLFDNPKNLYQLDCRPSDNLTYE